MNPGNVSGVTDVHIRLDGFVLRLGVCNGSVTTTFADVDNQILLLVSFHGRPQLRERLVDSGILGMLDDSLETLGMRSQVRPEVPVLIRITDSRAVNNDNVAAFNEIRVVLLERTHKYLLGLGEPLKVISNDLIVTLPVPELGGASLSVCRRFEVHHATADNNGIALRNVLWHRQLLGLRRLAIILLLL